MEIEKLVADIIPPDDYQHRNGFSNAHIIDQLSSQDRIMVEEILINQLSEKADMLIVETLAYMRSLKVIPFLIDLLNRDSDPMRRLIIAASVFEINQSVGMISVGADAFRLLDNVFQKINGFYYLRKFRSNMTDDMIEEYTEHSDHLLSSAARQALNGKLS